MASRVTRPLRRAIAKGMTKALGKNPEGQPYVHVMAAEDLAAHESASRTEHFNAGATEHRPPSMQKEAPPLPPRPPSAFKTRYDF